MLSWHKYALTPSRSFSLSFIGRRGRLSRQQVKSSLLGTAIALMQIGEARQKFCEGGVFPTLAENPERREVGRTMLYVGFGSISGMIHLIARLPAIGRAVAILLIVTALIAPVR